MFVCKNDSKGDMDGEGKQSEANDRNSKEYSSYCIPFEVACKLNFKYKYEFTDGSSNRIDFIHLFWTKNTERFSGISSKNLLRSKNENKKSTASEYNSQL